MITLKGKPAGGGIAFGKIYIYSAAESKIIRKHIKDIDAELKRFDAARECAKDELDALYLKALSEMGNNNAMIFKIHQVMIDDEDYLESIRNIIADQALNAETAVAQTCDTFYTMFSEMDDSYIKERADDIKDVSDRIIRILSGEKEPEPHMDEPVIIVANDLSPSETVQFDKSSVLAFVTERGSKKSHASILARTLHIPSITGAAGVVNTTLNGKYAAADGYSGEIFIDPDMETEKRLRLRALDYKIMKDRLSRVKGRDCLSADGQKMSLFANIESISDIADAALNDAEGIGLFRSECMYIEASEYPKEEVQFSVYKEMLSKMPNKDVTIRTLDIRADKKASYFNLPKEDNPAMGICAIRLCFKNPQIFKTQLRALYRASVFGNLSIMFPMITSEWEMIKILEMIDEVKAGLDKDNIPYSNDVKLGCMIETPAAAIISDILAQYVDFFSIGTNDLTQYIMAADRQNKNLDIFCDTHNRAVIRFINMVVKNAHSHNVKVCLCGDSAADLDLTETFLALGIDCLSVVPETILPLKQKIINTDVSAVRDKILKEL